MPGAKNYRSWQWFLTPGTYVIAFGTGNTSEGFPVTYYGRIVGAPDNTADQEDYFCVECYQPGSAIAEVLLVNKKAVGYELTRAQFIAARYREWPAHPRAINALVNWTNTWPRAPGNRAQRALA